MSGLTRKEITDILAPLVEQARQDGIAEAAGRARQMRDLIAALSEVVERVEQLRRLL